MACGSLQGLHFSRTLTFLPLSSSLSSPKNKPNNDTSVSFAKPTFKIYSATSRSWGRSTKSRSRSRSRGCLQQFHATSIERSELDENPEGIISGEWPENFSLLSYEDLKAYLEPEIFKEKMQPSALLGEVMSTLIRTATVDQTLEEIDHHFADVSGLPVIDGEFKCIGVVSKKDKARASYGLKSKVGEVMSSPAITLSPEKTVLDAAALMLKEKVHRIPIVKKEGGQVIGMVTRTDVFNALEGLPS